MSGVVSLGIEPDHSGSSEGSEVWVGDLPTLLAGDSELR